MRTGILGGTFDPIHLGHLKVAEEVLTRLKLDEILFVPAGQPWLKAGEPVTAAGHRVQMVRLAVAGHPHFKLSCVEIDRPGPTYTVDTLTELRSQDGADELLFILGFDSLAQLPRWKDPSRLISLCRLVAVPRPGYPLPDMKALETAIPGLGKRLVVLDKPEVDISSSGVKQQVAQGVSIDQLVPAPVATYIRQHGLYLGTDNKS